MFLLTIGSAIMYMFATDAFEVAEKKPAGIYYRHGVDTRMATQSFMNEPLETVSPLSEQKFKNIALPVELAEELDHIKWCIWHGKSDEGISRFAEIIEKIKML